MSNDSLVTGAGCGGDFLWTRRNWCHSWPFNWAYSGPSVKNYRSMKPTFEQCLGMSSPELCRRLAERIRAERVERGLSQKRFAEACRIPLRTYKRFELNGKANLDTFVRVVLAFERPAGFESLFPPAAPRLAMTRIEQRLEEIQRRAATQPMRASSAAD